MHFPPPSEYDDPQFKYLQKIFFHFALFKLFLFPSPPSFKFQGVFVTADFHILPFITCFLSNLFNFCLFFPVVPPAVFVCIYTYAANFSPWFLASFLTSFVSLNSIQRLSLLFCPTTARYLSVYTFRLLSYPLTTFFFYFIDCVLFLDLQTFWY